MEDATLSRFYTCLLEFLMSSKQQIMAIGAEAGLTPMQAMTLMMSDINKPRPMNSFCLIFGCDASNVTGIIDGLEQKGLVSRQNDAHDRRIKVVKLEPAGLDLRRQMIKRLGDKSSSMFASLSSNEVQEFSRLIGKLLPFQRHKAAMITSTSLAESYRK